MHSNINSIYSYDILYIMKCVQIWKDFSDRQPNNPFVLEAKNKMSKYSKEDWEHMSKEATELMEDMAYFVNNNIGELPESIFDRVCLHYSTWFFNLTRSGVSLLAFQCENSDGHIEFLNQYAPGLNVHYSRLLRKYAHKAPVW
jgi:hypothetical protein